MANILIAESDPQSKTAYESIFQGHSHCVAIVPSGEAFLDILQEVDPDIAILAADLPGVSGLEVCRHLRSLPETARLPVIIVADYKSEEEAVSHIRAGADQYLTRPVRSAKLLTTINLLLGRCQPKFFMPLKPRRFAGKYAVDRILAQSPAASLYIASPPGAGSGGSGKVALKVMSPQGFPERPGLEAFERRIQSLLPLTHKGVAAILDYGIEFNKFYIVRPFIPGESLAEAVCGGPMSELTALIIARDIVDILKSNAAHHVVHDNIKPSNIIIGDDGAVTLVDFDIRRSIGQKTLKINERTFGSIQFMSPEHVAGAVEPTLKSDIFSLGLVLYYAVSGTLPLYGDDPLLAFRKYMSDDPLPLSTVSNAVSEDFSSLVERMTAKKVSARLSLQEISDVIDRMLA